MLNKSIELTSHNKYSTQTDSFSLFQFCSFSKEKKIPNMSQVNDNQQSMLAQKKKKKT